MKSKQRKRQGKKGWAQKLQQTGGPEIALRTSHALQAKPSGHMAVKHRPAAEALAFADQVFIEHTADLAASG